MAETASYPLSVWQTKPQSNGLVCRTDASGLDKQVIHKPIITAGPNSVKMKRGHVSKACTNCRKMHAGCDIQRPCSRCVFHRMESTCVDIPRKKRMSRSKKQGEDSPDDSPPEVTTAVMVENDKEDEQLGAPNEKVWKDTFNELFGEVAASTPTNSNSSLPATPANSNFFQPSLLLTDLLGSDTDKSFQPTDFLNSDNSLYESPKKDYQELKQQMEDLRQSNVMLESRLDTVTQELTEMRQKMQQMLQLLGGFFVPAPQNSTKNNNDV
jgi:hypothetical protein